jgi:hypothetical protein
MPRPKPLHFQIFQPELSSAHLIKLKEGGEPDPLTDTYDLCAILVLAMRINYGSKIRNATCKAENCRGAEPTQCSENC